VHLVALDDDWTEVSHWRQNALPTGRFLEVIGGLFYHVGEIFEFLARLARAGLYASGTSVSVSLVGMEGRQLYLPPGSGRSSLREEYTSLEPRIDFASKLSPSELANTVDVALKAATFLAQRFQWLEPPAALLKECIVDYMVARRQG